MDLPEMKTAQRLEIIYDNGQLIAINKPHGLLVHTTGMAADETITAVRLLRNQTGQWVFPAHRLDRKTAGVLLFSFDRSINSLMQQQFMNHEVVKTYHALVRGYTDDSGTIDYPVADRNGKLKEAITYYKTLQRVELPLPFGKFDTSRYSLVEIKPVTGRIHQIRKHFAHILHPIIGDRPHGCNKQNRFFLEKWNHYEMLLHARSLQFRHPINEVIVKITANYHQSFARMLSILGFPNQNAIF
jgi:tRNA pseudouridine65 synthase